MEEMKMHEEAMVSSTTKAAKVAAAVSDKLNPEAVAQVLKAIEIVNCADEEEPQGLFLVGGVEVLPRQSVNIVAAQKKSGKTNFAGLLMATCASAQHQVFGGFVSCTQKPTTVLLADTEQPLKDARRPLRRAMKTAGFGYDEQWSDHGINVLSFKDIDSTEETEVLVEGQKVMMRVQRLLLEEAVKRIHPDLLIIDGIADLLQSINDEAEARELMRFLDRLACEYNCAVIGMLHLNYGSGKIGGWAGTQANKKFTDCFTLRKRNGYFEVVHEGRGAEAPKLRFRILCPPGDKFGWWEYVPDNDILVTTEDMKRQELVTMLEGAPLPCKNAVLVQWIMSKDHHPSQSTADRLLRQCKEQGILQSRKEGRCSIWNWAKEEDAEEAEMDFED